MVVMFNTKLAELIYSMRDRFIVVPGSIDATFFLVTDRQISNIRRQIPKLKCFSSRLAVVFVQSNEARC